MKLQIQSDPKYIVPEYFVAYGEDLEALEREVNNKFASQEGWKLYGNLVGVSDNGWAQAMVKGELLK